MCAKYFYVRIEDLSRTIHMQTSIELETEKKRIFMQHEIQYLFLIIHQPHPANICQRDNPLALNAYGQKNIAKTQDCSSPRLHLRARSLSLSKCLLKREHFANAMHVARRYSVRKQPSFTILRLRAGPVDCVYAIT